VTAKTQQQSFGVKTINRSKEKKDGMQNFPKIMEKPFVYNINKLSGAQA
jgi:hypothetical protein